MKTTDLVDANVLSEPTRPQPDGRVIDWLGGNESELVIDAIVLGELRVGILSLPPEASGRDWTTGSMASSRRFSACRGTQP